MNGSTDVKAANGHPPPPRKTLRRTKPKTSFFSWAFFNLLRLSLWATVAFVAVRCPSSRSDLTDESSAVCTRYIDVKEYIIPHVQPHYDAHVKPYVDKAQPYVEHVHKQLYTPTARFAVNNYNIYGAPRVDQAQKYLQSEWDATVKPSLDQGQVWVLDQYNDRLAPHVNKVSEATSPYISQGKEQWAKTYDGVLVPLYDQSRPWVNKGYQQGRYVVVEVAYPYLERARLSASSLFFRKVWPSAIVIYGENVEPQLMRITERLGRYKDSKKLEAAVDEVDVSSSISSAAASASSVAAAPSSTQTTNSDSIPEDAKVDDVDVKEQVEADLKRWQEKFAVAADKGAEDLEERVRDITSRQIDVQAHGVGEALIVQLDGAVNNSLKDLRVFINDSISKLPANAAETEENTVLNKLLAQIRTSGEKIRTKAVDVRTWKKSYDEETSSLVQAALDSTLDVVDNIRDLGLQEIGMRWAYMEGVTYKDWSKYHGLKKTFDEWRQGVEVVALQHQGLTEARRESDEIQDKAMALAESAARELIRLKDVARWKVIARDSSEDFSTKVLPPKPVKAANSILSRGTEEIEDALSRASAAVVTEPTPSGVAEKAQYSASSAISAAQSGASILQSQASDSVVAAQSSVGDGLSKASESVASVVSEASSTASAASDSVSDYASDTAEELTRAAQEKKANHVWGGVAAGFVEAREPVLDEDFDNDWSEKISSYLDAAGDKASELTNAISQAIMKPTPTQGQVESVTSLASEQYLKALSAASSALYGTPQPAAESVSSVVVDKYAAAVAAASQAIYGTPTPAYESAASQVTSAYSSVATDAASVLSSISSAASVRLAEGLSAASAQYTNAKIAVGAQPPPVHQQYLADAQRRYYEGIGVAHDQYSRFVDAASGAVYGTPTPAYQSLASEASKKIAGTPAPAYQRLLSQATSQYNAALAAATSNLREVETSASSMLGMRSDSQGEQLLSSASAKYDSAFTAASEALVQAASSASIAVYGKPTGSVESIASVVSENVVGKETPWTEAAAAKASENFDAIVSRASEQIYGLPTPFAESVWNQAGGYAAQATDVAALHYANVRDLVSELVVGKEPDFTESVYNRLSSAYYTGAFAAAASASSYASEVYDSATSGAADAALSASSVVSEAYESASSVVTSVFTPPPTLEAIIDNASAQFQSAIDAASVQVYGTEPGYVEKAASAASSVASSAHSAASSAVYGTQPGYVEAAQATLAAAAAEAQKQISEAIYGTPTGSLEGAASAVGESYAAATDAAGSHASYVYDSAASAGSVAYDSAASAGAYVADSAASAASAVSKAVYGPEYGTWESASVRIAAAASSASARVQSIYEEAGLSVEEAKEKVKSVIGDHDEL